MPEIGQSLSHYSITAKIGKGGMGEVYRAKDQKLGRDVAIKVLPEEFARDADRVARFQREAKLLASLNHPNIAGIHGLEESGETQFLVMELIEGDTLAEQIKRGRIPVEESLKLALQITEALEAAHEKGVIHRDLKPANIKVTSDGKVKVLDFGLAKAFAGDREEVNLSNSPTLSNAATQQGVILGTAAYMSPEQARGKAVDKRADIWAFGCVLFEMLAGRVAFRGEDVSEILASVIKGDLQLDLLPEDLHPRVREAITRCLQKDVRRRYSSITAARYEIEQVLADPGGVFAAPAAALENRSRARSALKWIAAVVAVGLLAAAVVWKLRAPEPRRVTRFEYSLPEGQQFNINSGVNVGHTLAVSPDGGQIVYSTNKGLFLRSEEELEAKIIQGTESNPQSPFFSPDGKWIGYWSQGDSKLKKIMINGGAATALCDAGWVYGAIWYPGNTIVFSDVQKGIMRVSANGGAPETLIKARTATPQILPGGESVIFTDISAAQQFRIMVQPLPSGEQKVLGAGFHPRYLPTGHLTYILQNTLYAVPFDPDTYEMKGGPVPVIEGIDYQAVSDSGTLAYRPLPKVAAAPAASASSRRTLVWVDRLGNEEPIPAPPDDYAYPQISPEGTRIALTIGALQQETDIWIWDIARRTMNRLTFEKGHDVQSIWSPDGKKIAFASTRDGALNLYWKAADGTGKDEKLLSRPGRNLIPYSWSGDGKSIVVADVGGNVMASSEWDIGVLSLEGERTYKLLVKERFTEVQPQVSPDGRWIAYLLNEKEGQLGDIYVRPFPEADRGKWQVSTGGGSSPRWSTDSKELFYLRGDNSMISVAVGSDPAFSFGSPKTLFRSIYAGVSGSSGTPYDIHPDGKRFLMMKLPGAPSTAANPQKINIVLNWFEELKQRVPAK